MIDSGIDKPGHSLRLLTAQAIGLYGDGELLKFLLDGDLIVRSAAARELQVRGKRRTLKPILELLGSSEDISREMAAFVLGQFGTPRRPFADESSKALLHLVKSERNPQVLSVAIVSLGQLEAHAALRYLKRFTTHEDSEVRAALGYFLGLANARRPRLSVDATRAMKELEGDRHRAVRSAVQFARDMLS